VSKVEANLEDNNGEGNYVFRINKFSGIDMEFLVNQVY
jgi:hypothetical protein